MHLIFIVPWIPSLYDLYYVRMFFPATQGRRKCSPLAVAVPLLEGWVEFHRQEISMPPSQAFTLVLGVFADSVDILDCG